MLVIHLHAQDRLEASKEKTSKEHLYFLSHFYLWLSIPFASVICIFYCNTISIGLLTRSLLPIKFQFKYVTNFFWHKWVHSSVIYKQIKEWSNQLSISCLHFFDCKSKSLIVPMLNLLNVRNFFFFFFLTNN